MSMAAADVFSPMGMSGIPALTDCLCQQQSSVSFCHDFRAYSRQPREKGSDIKAPEAAGVDLAPPRSMSSLSRLSRTFAVHGVFWRKCLDWVVINIPSYFHPILIFLSTIAFFMAARPARRTVVEHLNVIFPHST